MKIVQLSAIDMTLNNFMYPLNRATKDQGIDVHCVSSKGPYYDNIIKDGFEFHDVTIARKISPLQNLKSIMDLVKLFKKIKPDIVHVHTPVASVLGRIAAKIANVPVIIYTAHGFYFHDGMTEKQYKFYFNIEKYIGRFCTDYIFTQSEEDYDVAVKHRFLSRRKRKNYVCISNGIDLDGKYNINHFSDNTKSFLRKKYNLKETDLVVSFIGRLVKEKGIIDLLEAYPLLNSNNVKFLVIGGLPQGERDTDTFEKLKTYENNPNIIFTGHVDNVNEHLYLSDIFCLPSYREGMPRSIIEAMAMGNAVLATNIRGSREEVLHNETGFLFPTGDSQSIAKYIDDLAFDNEKLKTFKQNGLERAHELYDENKVVEKQLNIFNKYRRD